MHARDHEFKSRHFQREKKGREKGELTKGEYGLKAREGGRVSARQREAGRKRRRHKRNRRGKVWVEVFPDRPVTKKPREVRMGGGKGRKKRRKEERKKKRRKKKKTNRKGQKRR